MGRGGGEWEDVGKKSRANWKRCDEDLVWLGSEEAAVLQLALTGITM